MESLRSINYNGPFDTKAHDRPFDKKAHDRQNSLNLKSKFKNLKLHPTFRGTKMGIKSLYENKRFSTSQVITNAATTIAALFIEIEYFIHRRVAKGAENF
jgi:hypothetical protein